MIDIKKEENNKLSLKNIDLEKLIAGKSGWKKFIIDSLLWLAILLMIFGYMHDTKLCREIISNPQEFCSKVSFGYNNNLGNSDFYNITVKNETSNIIPNIINKTS